MNETDVPDDYLVRPLDKYCASKGLNFGLREV